MMTPEHHEALDEVQERFEEDAPLPDDPSVPAWTVVNCKPLAFTGFKTVQAFILDSGGIEVSDSRLIPWDDVSQIGVETKSCYSDYGLELLGFHIHRRHQDMFCLRCSKGLMSFHFPTSI